jgi:hypothetical protein
VDVLLEDARIIDADVAAALADGVVEFDMQVRADTAQAAMQSAAEAVADAVRVAASDAWTSMPRIPSIDHAEIDRVPVPA